MLKQTYIKAKRLDKIVTELQKKGYDRMGFYKIGYFQSEHDTVARFKIDYLFLKKGESGVDSYKERGFFNIVEVESFFELTLASYQKFSFYQLSELHRFYQMIHSSSIDDHLLIQSYIHKVFPGTNIDELFTRCRDHHQLKPSPSFRSFELKEHPHQTVFLSEHS